MSWGGCSRYVRCIASNAVNYAFDLLGFKVGSGSGCPPRCRNPACMRCSDLTPASFFPSRQLHYLLAPINWFGLMDSGKRRHKACDTCSQRKVRCNGQQRCQQCEHLNLLCKYSAPAPRQKYERRSTKSAKRLKDTIQAIAPIAVSDDVHDASWTAGINEAFMQYQAGAGVGDNNFFLALLSDFEAFVLPFHPAISMAEAQNAIETMSENQEARAFVYGLVAVTLNLTHSLRSKTTPESSDISKWVSMSLDALRPVLLQENISVQRVATLQFLHVCFMGLGRYDVAFYYLRQSVTMLEILRVRDSSSMLMLPFTERSQRQRMYWTVFVSQTLP